MCWHSTVLLSKCIIYSPPVSVSIRIPDSVCYSAFHYDVNNALGITRLDNRQIGNHNKKTNVVAYRVVGQNEITHGKAELKVGPQRLIGNS